MCEIFIIKNNIKSYFFTITISKTNYATINYLMLKLFVSLLALSLSYFKRILIIYLYAYMFKKIHLND